MLHPAVARRTSCPGPCSGEPQLRAAGEVQREGEKQQSPLYVRVWARLPAHSPPPAACSHFMLLTGFLALNWLMSRRGKQQGPRAPELGQQRGRAAPPSIAYGGERDPPPTLVPHWVLPVPGAPWPAPLTPSTSPPPQQPHAGALREGCPVPLPPRGWLNLLPPPSAQVSLIPLSPASPRWGAGTAPQEDEAETMTHRRGGESGSAR